MKRFIIEDLFEIAEAMYNEIENNNKEEAMFVGKYDEAVSVVKELIMLDYVIPYSVDIHPEELDGYDKEYYVTLDENLELWCEPAFPNDAYLYSATNILFVMNDCNSSILNKIDYDESVEVTFGYEEDYLYPECGECCGECGCHECNSEDNEELETPEENTITTRVAVDKDGNIRGFEKTWRTHEGGMKYFSSYSHYSNNQDMIKLLMENFDVKMN